MPKPKKADALAAIVANASPEQVAALMAMLQPSAPKPSKVASLATAIPETLWQPLVDTFVKTVDDETRGATFREAVLTFGRALPDAFHDKPLPDDVVKPHADAVAVALYASYPEAERSTDRVKKIVAQKRSRAVSLFTCAGILPKAVDRGLDVGVTEMLKFCRALKDAKYDLSAALAEREKQANAPTDHMAAVLRAVGAIFNATDANIPALSAHAKAQLVAWCDEWSVNHKEVGKHRNAPLARLPRPVA